MIILNKKITLLFLVIFFLIISIAPALAGSDVDIAKIKDNLANSAKQGGLETSSNANIPEIIGQLINYMFGILGIVFLVYSVIGGILWMIAGGNEEKVIRAKKFIIGGIDGLVIIFMAYALVYVVLAGLEFATKP